MGTGVWGNAIRNWNDNEALPKSFEGESSFLEAQKPTERWEAFGEPVAIESGEKSKAAFAGYKSKAESISDEKNQLGKAFAGYKSQQNPDFEFKHQPEGDYGKRK